MTWTPDRIETMLKMLSEGSSRQKIADELGNDVTKNAVIGKLRRMGIGGRHDAADRLTVMTGVLPKKSTSKKRVTARKPKKQSETPEVAFEKEVALQSESSVESDQECVTLDELSEDMCRWPVDHPTKSGFYYCGRFKDKGSYCTEHSSQSTDERRPRRKENEHGIPRSFSKLNVNL